MAMYLSSDMIKDGMPFPSASNVPLITTEIAETINPALMMRRATAPCCTVCGVSVNMSISCLGIARQRIVPITITPQAEQQCYFEYADNSVFPSRTKVIAN